MGRKVRSDEFARAMEKVLSEYGDSVKDNVDEVANKLTKKGVQQVRRNAGANFNGNDYRKSWTSKFETGRLSSQGTIYSQIPGLPHLLEFGHALRQGGRTAPRAHIKPVEEELIQTFEREVKAKL